MRTWAPRSRPDQLLLFPPSPSQYDYRAPVCSSTPAPGELGNGIYAHWVPDEPQPAAPASQPTWLRASLEFPEPASPCPHLLPSFSASLSLALPGTCVSGRSRVIWTRLSTREPSPRDTQLGGGQPWRRVTRKTLCSGGRVAAALATPAGSLGNRARDALIWMESLPAPSREPVWHQSRRAWVTVAQTRFLTSVSDFARVCEMRNVVLMPGDVMSTPRVSGIA